MRSYFETHRPNNYQPGRPTEMFIKEMLTYGQQLLYGNASGAPAATDGLDEPHRFVLEGDDFGV